MASSACGGARENTATSSPFSSSFSMPPSATAPTSSDLHGGRPLLMHPHDRAAALVHEVPLTAGDGIELDKDRLTLSSQVIPCIVCDDLIKTGPAAGEHHGGKESGPVLSNLCAQESHSEDELSSGRSASWQHQWSPVFCCVTHILCTHHARQSIAARSQSSRLKRPAPCKRRGLSPQPQQHLSTAARMATVCQVLQLGHSTSGLGSVKRPAQQHTMLDVIHACCHTRKLGVGAIGGT